MSVAVNLFNRSEVTADHLRTKEQGRWLDSRLHSLRGMRSEVKGQHRARVKRGGLSVANRQLRLQVDSLRNRGLLFAHGVTFDFGLSMDADDQEIREFAEGKARQCERVLYAESFPALLVVGVLERCRIDAGFMVQKRNKKPLNWEARVCCVKWWRRKLRVVCARGAEAVARDSGLTSRRSGCYVSGFTFGRWLSQQRRNAALLEEMVAINDHGESFSVAELAALGQSNPELRRGELMVRIRGFQEWADADSDDWVPMFYTLTCPSKYHIYSGDRKNDKYSGYTPRAAQAYLCKVWAKVRAEAARKKIETFGFRVAEPHHDGCPHWHLLLFVRKSQSGLFTESFRSYALAEDGGESGASEHRFTAVEISPEKGTAAGYIAKYVAKNIDGFGVGFDYEAGELAKDTAARVRAWASVWGVRQFQQIGGPPVTVWRELRRAARNQDRVHNTDQLELVLNPADAGDWSGFTQAMGGAVCPRDARPAKVLYSERDEKTKEEKKGRYGEVVRRVLGVIGADFLVVTRFREWVVEFKNKVKSMSPVRVVAGFDLFEVKPLSEGFKFNPRFKYADGICWSGFLGVPKARPLDLCQ